ncbi:MAG: hypothetical protein M3238_03550 [Actinomycetota bacterium]|nr:hypothetical protein [Actinomycetota bacterium]
MRAGVIRAQSVSTRPNHRNITKRGTHSADAGIMRATTEVTTTITRARRLAVATTKPAHEAMRTVTGTATATTNSELRIWPQRSTDKVTNR